MAPDDRPSTPRLVLRPRPVAPAPRLDDAQRRVVAHTGSPLLVLAGPGTGKTTTIVEAVVARLGGPRPLPPEEVLVLTFSRVAAGELRSRIVARSGAGPAPTVATFHSFAWQLLRGHAPEATAPEVLLSGADQELAVRELLAAPDPAWFDLWPADRREALRSPGLAEEVIGLMAAARAQGWEPEMLAAAAAAAAGVGPSAEVGAPAVPVEWRSAAAFFEHYLQVLDWRGAVDYSEVVHRARLLVASDPALIGRYRAIYVDEFQDTDPAQVALIRALAGPGTTVVAVGDPDQAIYRFRGAEVRGILDFRSSFPQADGFPCDVVVLGRTRRFGPQIRAVADAWIDPVGLGALPARVQRDHRRPECDGPDGVVEVLAYRTADDQAAAIADLLRRAHLSAESPLPWSDMAVLVRSGLADLPRLQRALLHAGVPVEIPAGDIPLGHEPALAPVITGLRLADEPGAVGLADLEAFLCSPLIGMTPLSVRRMMRSMRTAERARVAREGGAPAHSAALLAACFAPGARLPAGVGGEVGQSFAEVIATIDMMREPGLDLQQRLWYLLCHGGDEFVGGSWMRGLRARALRGGSGANAADLVLDAVVELFRLAARMPRGTGASVFVDTLVRHRVPSARVEDATFVRDSVRLLTVHRAKGAQWPLVVLVGLQQDSWPDSRGPVSLLAAERIAVDGVRPPRTRRELADDERRLAFVAATRARHRLIITAIDSDAGDEAPSMLFAEAAAVVGDAAAEGVAPAAPVGPRDRLTAASVVASLRTALADPTRPAELRDAAARRLNFLARPHPGLGIVARQASPSTWWGVAESTRAEHPLTPPGEPVRLSATAVEGLITCPARWFLQRRAEASSPRAAAAGYGSLLHAAIAAVYSGALPADAAAMADAIRPAFEQLPYGAVWEAERAWLRVGDDLARFIRWHEESPRRPLAGEFAFDVTLRPGAGGGVVESGGGSPGGDVPGGPDVQLVGSIDLVDVDGAGALHVVDFKTGASVPSARETAENLQLGVYQRALGSSQVPEVTGTPEVAGGSLVFLAKGAGKGGQRPTERHQAPLGAAEWLDAQVGEAAGTVADERIVARRGPACERCVFKPMCPAWSQAEWIDRPEEAGR